VFLVSTKYIIIICNYLISVDTAYEKLSSCVAKQKGMKFFESVRSFDPQYVRVHGWQDKWEDISPHLPQFDIDLYNYLTLLEI